MPQKNKEREELMMDIRDERKQIINVWKSIGKSVLKSASVLVLLAVLIVVLPSIATAQAPCWNIDVVGNHIYCANWQANALLTVTVSPGGSAQKMTDGTGFAVLSFPFDIKGGDWVTVTDGTTTLSYPVHNISVDCADPDNDTVSGTADPGTEVWVHATFLGVEYKLIVVTSSSGHWIADYSAIGDILPGDRGTAWRTTNVYPYYIGTSFSWTAGPCVSGVGEVLSFSGEVYINSVRVQDLGSLELGDIVSTRADGQVDIQLGEATFSLDSYSIVKIAETSTPIVTSLEGLKGSIFANVRRLSPQQCFEVKTPQAVAGVRGTEMLIEATQDETRVIMLEHESEVSNVDGSQSIVLRELQGVVVTAAGIGEPYPVSPSEIERFWEQMVISVASPVNLYVTDPLGRHIGWSLTGEIVNEIPGATYTGPSAVPEEINIPSPVQGNYDIELIAVGTGPYHLSIAGMGLGDETFLDEYSGTIEEPNETVSFQAGYEQTEESLQVNIDIMPGSFPNAVNPRSKGKIPVAVLTDENFDATTVDWETVLFGVHGTEAEPVHHAFEDVDGDGDIDMIFHFRTRDTDIQCGNTSAYLRGFTLDHKELEGYDSIKPVGCKKKSKKKSK